MSLPRESVWLTFKTLTLTQHAFQMRNALMESVECMNSNCEAFSLFDFAGNCGQESTVARLTLNASQDAQIHIARRRKVTRTFHSASAQMECCFTGDAVSFNEFYSFSSSTSFSFSMSTWLPWIRSFLHAWRWREVLDGRWCSRQPESSVERWKMLISFESRMFMYIWLSICENVIVCLLRVWFLYIEWILLWKSLRKNINQWEIYWKFTWKIRKGQVGYGRRQRFTWKPVA